LKNRRKILERLRTTILSEIKGGSIRCGFQKLRLILLIDLSRRGHGVPSPVGAQGIPPQGTLVVQITKRATLLASAQDVARFPFMGILIFRRHPQAKSSDRI
jgi:hypothetical protein